MSGPASSQPRRYRVRSRISRLAFGGGGGITVRQALAEADKVLASMRGDGLAMVDASIAALLALSAAPAGSLGAAEAEQAYAAASAILDAAAVVPDWDLDRAAWSLCDLIDAADGAPDWPSVGVHASALALLRRAQGALPRDSRRRVMDGLEAIRRKHVPGVAAPATGEA